MTPETIYLEGGPRDGETKTIYEGNAVTFCVQERNNPPDYYRKERYEFKGKKKLIADIWQHSISPYAVRVIEYQG